MKFKALLISTISSLLIPCAFSYVSSEKSPIIGNIVETVSGDEEVNNMLLAPHTLACANYNDDNFANDSFVQQFINSAHQFGQGVKTYKLGSYQTHKTDCSGFLMQAMRKMGLKASILHNSIWPLITPEILRGATLIILGQETFSFSKNQEENLIIGLWFHRRENGRRVISKSWMSHQIITPVKPIIEVNSTNVAISKLVKSSAVSATKTLTDNKHHVLVDKNMILINVMVETTH